MPSRIEKIIANMLGATYTLDPPQSRIEEQLIEILESGGGGGGGGTAGVTSFKGRRGAVVPQSGDYTAAMIRASAAGRTVQSYIDEYDANKTPDTALSASSEKPVQNKVITQRILEVEGKVMPSGGRGGAILTKRSDANYDAAWESSDAYMKKAVYDRNNNGKADRSELADAVQGPIYKATLRGTRADTTLLTDEDKGVANGVVPLDSGRKILPEYLPDSITNGLTNGSGNKAMARVEQSGDPLDTNNPIQSAGSHTHSFDLNGNVTQTKVATMPPYLTVNVWKRTA